MRTRTRGWLVMGLMVAAATCRAAPADDININVVRMASAVSGGAEFNRGYAAARIEVSNSSRRYTHTVELKLGGYGTRVAVRQFKLLPGASTRVMWASPMFRYDYLTALVDGDTKSIGNPNLGAIKSYFPGAPEPCLLVSRRVEFDPLDDKLNTSSAVAAIAAVAAPSSVRRSGPPPTGRKAALFRAEMEADAWFGERLAYSCYDAVILAPDDWGKMTPEVRDALTRYAECGGTVLVFDRWDPPAGWESALESMDCGFRVRQVGFGRWIRIPAPGSRDLTPAHISTLLSLLDRQRYSADDVSKALSAFTIVPNISVPIGGISLFIISFVVMAGPLNLFFVIRKKRRLWLLWTTPLLGLVFSGALIVYFFFSEGVSQRGRIQAVTLLNENTKRASTLAVDGVYCPIPPRGGLIYGAEWELAWRGEDSYRGPGGDTARLNLDTAQQLDGFVAARVPFATAMRGSRHAAERLPVTIKADGGVDVVNGLGAVVKTLLVALPDGREFESGAAIAAGAKAALLPAGKPKGKSVASSSLVTACAWAADALPPGIQLQRGSYAAELDRAVFAQKGLPGAAYRETQIVIGIMPTAKGGVQ